MSSKCSPMRRVMRILAIDPGYDRLGLAVLEGNASTPPVGNVVVLSGDMHSSWAADLTRDPNNSDVASGGYDADSGAGSRAVEFVCTSVTSPSIIDTGSLAESALRLVNPHFKYIDLTRRGYLLLDADATRVIGEWWYVDTVESPSNRQSSKNSRMIRSVHVAGWTH